MTPSYPSGFSFCIRWREQLSAVPLEGNVPLIHSPPDCALSASMHFVLVMKKKNTDKERDGPEKSSDLKRHLKCNMTSTHLLTDAWSANALALYAATPFRRKCSTNVVQICIMIIRTHWMWGVRGSDNH